MKTTLIFQKLIRKNKKKLIDVGINQYTVRSWAYGFRSPDFKNAVIISQTLGIQLNDIPYSQRIYHKP